MSMTVPTENLLEREQNSLKILDQSIKDLQHAVKVIQDQKVRIKSDEKVIRDLGNRIEGQKKLNAKNAEIKGVLNLTLEEKNREYDVHTKKISELEVEVEQGKEANKKLEQKVAEFEAKLKEKQNSSNTWRNRALTFLAVDVALILGSTYFNAK